MATVNGVFNIFASLDKITSLNSGIIDVFWSVYQTSSARTVEQASFERVEAETWGMRESKCFRQRQAKKSVFK